MYFSWSGGPKPPAPHNSCFADAPAGQASLALQTTQVVVMITMMVIMMGMGMMMMMVLLLLLLLDCYCSMIEPDNIHSYYWS